MMTDTRTLLRAVPLFALALSAAQPAIAETIAALREKLDVAVTAAKTAPEKSLEEVIRDFYAKRENRSLWFDQGGLNARGKTLLAVLARAPEHGLNPASYGMPKLAERAAKADGASRSEIEHALTRAYLDYAGDVSSGVVENPRKVQAMFRDPKRPDPRKLLDDVAKAGDFAKFLENLPPDTRRYQNLKVSLAQYRAIEKKGGWPAVDNGPTLKPGMTHARVAQVKRRLAVTGDYIDRAAPSNSYDDALVAAVKKFQARHGLAEDGNVGAETLAAMNVPVKDRIEQLVINLERRRWLGGYLGDRYIYVNIADHDLKVVDKDKTIYTARVVVGKVYHETPVFSGTLSYIELNPYWNVPHSIATKEMLPIIRRNPGYLDANDYLVLTRMGDNSSAVPSASVDWSSLSTSNFPYQLRQLPGPKNALGTTLFMFPNAHNVFIHDTPGRNIFSLEDRYFSHGCVRVEHPMKLAMLVLKDLDGTAWTEQRIKATLEKKDPTRIDLKQPIPVHITYLTAWADPDGTVQFRKDAYKRDGTLKAAIRQIAMAR